MGTVTDRVPWDPAVDPVLCSPYEPPDRHWKLDSAGQAIRGSAPADRRRDPAFVGTAPADRKTVVPQLLEVGDRPVNTLVKEIRESVGAWRRDGYQGVTATTRALLNHWADPEGPRIRLFFAQREAAETIIWLREVATRQNRLRRELEAASREHNDGIVRYCAKMATGTGKTATADDRESRAAAVRAHVADQSASWRSGSDGIAERLPEQLDGALNAVYHDYTRTFDMWKQGGQPTPPVMIIVANNSRNAEAIYHQVAGSENGHGTIDSSRVAIAIARRHLITRVYPWWSTLDGGSDPAAGFRTEVFQRTSAATLAYGSVDDPENTILLVDRPETDRKRRRLTGPFTIESSSPYTYLPFSDPGASGDRIGAVVGDEAATLLEALTANPISDTEGYPTLQVVELEAWPEGILATHEARCQIPGRDTEVTVAVMLGAPDVTVAGHQATQAATEARRNRSDIAERESGNSGRNPDAPHLNDACTPRREATGLGPAARRARRTARPPTPTATASHKSHARTVGVTSAVGLTFAPDGRWRPREPDVEIRSPDTTDILREKGSLAARERLASRR